MQLELLRLETWAMRDELANAVFEWIVCWHKTMRRHAAAPHSATNRSDSMRYVPTSAEVDVKQHLPSRGRLP